MKIFAIGDVVSEVGCRALRRFLPAFKKERGIDLCLANGENSAVGNGILPRSAEYLLDSGVDLITTGNHVLRRREIYDFLDASPFIIRPANYHSSAPGRGIAVIDKGFVQVAVINLQGLVYMDPLENPFVCMDRMLGLAEEAGCRIVLVDFHAEATAEKRAMGFYLDGKVSALYGTHTHVPTADGQVLPGGTGYITDLGMTGPLQSVLGVTPERAIEKMRTGLPVRFENPDVPCILQGCVFEIDHRTGRCLSVQPVQIGKEDAAV